MIDLNKIYLNQYIYSPITRYHTINKYATILTVYNILFIILYLDTSKIIILTIFLIIIWSIYNKNIKFITVNNIKNNLFYLVHTFILNYLLNNKQINNKDIIASKLIIPLKLQFNLSRNKFKLEYYYILYFIPKYLVKLLLIYIIYYNLIQILFTFTEAQIIIQNLINYLNKILPSSPIIYSKSIMNLYLGYQTLENTIYTRINNSIGQKMKSKYIINKKQINIIIILTKYYNYLLCEDNNNSFILWNRNIIYNNFINLQYYY